MAAPLIVIGDKTSHGGTVIEASGFTSTGETAIARVCDKVSCPKKGHGVCPIVTGDPTLIIDGKPAARAGDTTACGAVLIAGQASTTA